MGVKYILEERFNNDRTAFIMLAFPLQTHICQQNEKFM